VPGGKTPIGFYKLLSTSGINWSNVCFILSDERMVPWDHQYSNYFMIREMLLEQLPAKNKPMVIPEMKDYLGDNMEEFLYKTNLTLKENFPVRYAFLGIGSDGHTASLFSDNDITRKDKNNFFYTNKFNESIQRMTLSFDFLKSIPEISFLVSGKSKYACLNKIIKNDQNISKSPAHQLIEQAVGNVFILCDYNAYFMNNHD
tara:strand:- start:1636 stop:2241 length:606 start_codon:yes stop_codon:yes gene_type:complete